jgi:putative hydrolase of the HAD superfamily
LSDIFDPDPDMLAVVAAVRRAGLKTGLLSNTVPAHVAFLRRRHPECFAGFDAVTLSYEARAAKPEPAIYRAAVAALGVPAAQAWFVDDLAANVAGAAAAGLRASRFVGRAALLVEFAAAGLRLDLRAD